MAIDAPRWRVEQGRQVVFEASLDRNTLAALRLLRHQVTRPLQGLQLRRRAGDCDPQGFYIPATESRKDGQAVVF